MLPTDVQELLRLRIGSYEQLHVLLLLFQGRAEWSVEALAAHLKVSADSASQALSALAAHGLVARASEPPEPKYRYASGRQDAAVEALVRAHQEQPLAIIRLLAEQSIERIRADALRAFADAFLFRKGK